MIGNETIVLNAIITLICQTRFPWELGRQDASTMPLSNNVLPSSSAFERQFYQDLADTDEVPTNTYTKKQAHSSISTVRHIELEQRLVKSENQSHNRRLHLLFVFFIIKWSSYNFN